MLRCRICRSSDLRVVVDLGDQALSGVFPRTVGQVVDSGPLRVAKCRGCGLAQLTESHSPSAMYGDNYGYRSGLNDGMKRHLRSLTRTLESRVQLSKGDVVMDIGANDGTLLRSYSVEGLNKVAVDPTIGKFAEFYSDDINTAMVADFFSAQAVERVVSKKAKLVTSIAMFYDLDDPIGFAREVASVLEPSGVWMLEQSYAPWMVRSGAYDTICHEHLEYYSLTDVAGIMDAASLQILDVTTNQVNGGSFNVLVGKEFSSSDQSPLVDWMLCNESESGANSVKAWLEFGAKVEFQMQEFRHLLLSLAESGASVKALGASTKGNVLLQSCDVGPDLISEIGEVNSEKFGSFTPGTRIPIVPEEEVIGSKPNYIVVLPWHFRQGFLSRLEDYLSSGGRVIFPLPDLEIVGN